MFTIFGVNTDGYESDEDKAQYEKNCAELGVTWPNLLTGTTGSAPPRSWGITYYPSTFVVDAAGVIRGIDSRGEGLEKLVDELVAEALAKRNAE